MIIYLARASPFRESVLNRARVSQRIDMFDDLGTKVIEATAADRLSIFSSKKVPQKYFKGEFFFISLRLLNIYIMCMFENSKEAI
jgi:hypothetical protein